MTDSKRLYVVIAIVIFKALNIVVIKNIKMNLYNYVHACINSYIHSYFLLQIYNNNFIKKLASHYSTSMAKVNCMLCSVFWSFLHKTCHRFIIAQVNSWLEQEVTLLEITTNCLIAHINISYKFYYYLYTVYFAIYT